MKQTLFYVLRVMGADPPRMIGQDEESLSVILCVSAIQSKERVTPPRTQPKGQHPARLDNPEQRRPSLP